MIKSRRRPEDKPVRDAKRLSLEARRLASKTPAGSLSTADRNKILNLRTELRIIGAALKMECTRIGNQLDERLQQKSNSAIAISAYRHTQAALNRASIARNF